MMSEEKDYSSITVQKNYVGPHFNKGLGKHVDNYSDLKAKMKKAGLAFEDGSGVSKEWAEKAHAEVMAKRSARAKGKTIYSFGKR